MPRAGPRGDRGGDFRAPRAEGRFEGRGEAPRRDPRFDDRAPRFERAERPARGFDERRPGGGTTRIGAQADVVTDATAEISANTQENITASGAVVVGGGATPQGSMQARATMVVGASAQIRAELLALRDAGCALLLVSEELDELFELSDRLFEIKKIRVHKRPSWVDGQGVPGQPVVYSRPTLRERRV